MNENERQVGLINVDGKNLSHIEIFEQLVKERFDEIIELTNETSFHGFIYYFEDDKARKRFLFPKWGKTFWKNETWLYQGIRSKKLKNIFKSNLKEMVREKYKLKGQESALQNIKI